LLWQQADFLQRRFVAQSAWIAYAFLQLMLSRVLPRRKATEELGMG
jgi:hypothetical protein